MALDREGTGVAGGVESLEVLLIGERYPEKLPARGWKGGALIACLSRCELADSSVVGVDDFSACLMGVFSAVERAAAVDLGSTAGVLDAVLVLEVLSYSETFWAASAVVS